MNREQPFIRLAQKKIIHDRKKPAAKRFSLSSDLKKRRYALLTKAKGLLVAYVFCDINCSLAIKLNGNTYKYFNSENELTKVLVPTFFEQDHSMICYVYRHIE